MVLKLLGILAAVLACLQYVPYIRDIIKGKTKPERAAWLIWLVLGGVLVASQLAKGGRDSILITFVQMSGNALVLVLAFKYGSGGLARRDWAALTAAGVGIVLWLLTKQPLMALAIAVSVDALGNVLTIRKAYHQPHSETLITWAMSGTAATCAALAVGSWDWALLAYPVSVMVANAVTVSVIMSRRRQLAVVPDSIEAEAPEPAFVMELPRMVDGLTRVKTP